MFLKDAAPIIKSCINNVACFSEKKIVFSGWMEVKVFVYPVFERLRIYDT